MSENKDLTLNAEALRAAAMAALKKLVDQPDRLILALTSEIHAVVRSAVLSGEMSATVRFDVDRPLDERTFILLSEWMKRATVLLDWNTTFTRRRGMLEQVDYFAIIQIDWSKNKPAGNFSDVYDPKLVQQVVVAGPPLRRSVQ